MGQGIKEIVRIQLTFISCVAFLFSETLLYHVTTFGRLIFAPLSVNGVIGAAGQIAWIISARRIVPALAQWKEPVLARTMS